MGILGGLWETGSNMVKGATAPLVGICKMGLTGLETAGKVTGDLLTFQGGKAIDDLCNGFKEQGKNLIDIPKTQWSALKGEVHGLGETIGGSVGLVGEPIRGVLRVGANHLQTAGAAGGDVLDGNFRQAGVQVGLGIDRDVSIVKETATNQLHNLI